MTTSQKRTRGRVRSGLGDHAQWIALLVDHYRRLTGETLYPGTLNIELEADWSVPDEASCLRAEDYGGRVSIYVVPCRFMGEPAWVLRTLANERGDGDHPRTIVEIASPFPLRERHGLADGDLVELTLLSR